MEAKRKRGRPKIENPKSETLHLRFTKDEFKMLNELKEMTGKTKSQIIRDAIHTYINSKEGDKA